MTTDVVTIGPLESVIEARKVLDDHALNHLPVVDDGKLVGILSAADMLKFFMLDRDAAVLNSILVRQAMQFDPVVLSSTANLREAAEKLRSGSFHALPVIYPDKTLAGIVTSSDLIEHLLKQIPRDDGSIRTQHLTPTESNADDFDVSAVVQELKRESAGGNDLGDTEKALLTLHARNKQLNAVFQAADRYVRSGHADHEHTVLVKCIDAMWSLSTRLDL
ncbi:MAG: CBS domain-containing protein [Woeseiaceae bacterium]|nr:CBS domain-containing protein [Woeseiaceae bacterium]